MLAIPLSLAAALISGATTVTSTVTSTVPPRPPTVVTVRATDFAFTAPARIAAGPTTFRMVNAGKELHHVTVIRLTRGKTMADYVNAMKKPGPPPAWATDAGGPNGAVPGQSAEATMTLEAGKYVLVCFIPSPGERAPHLMKGMVRELTVTPAKSAAMAPKADVDMRLTDYAFTLSKPLAAGRHVVRVVNDAAQSHEFQLVRLAPGKTAMEVAHWVEDGMKGPPPGMPIGGVTAVAKGRAVLVPVELSAGSYGLICFLPDAKDGKPHFVHGMAQTFTVGAR